MRPFFSSLSFFVPGVFGAVLGICPEFCVSYVLGVLFIFSPVCLVSCVVVAVVF